MDPALIREREAFRKRAIAQPTIEKRKAKVDNSSKRPNKRPRVAPKPKEVDYKRMVGSSHNNFAILAKIVKHLKTKHQEGDSYDMTVDEILDETNQLDIGAPQKHWLATQAMSNNPKIEVILDADDTKYKFKPVYTIRNSKGLLKLLDKHDQRGLGGILLDDVEESLPRAQKALKILGDQVLTVTRSTDKKKVLFYNDKGSVFTVDEEIKKMWRSAAVEGMDENKIEEYLQRQGIASMQDVGGKKVAVQKRKKGGKKKKGNVMVHNEHLASILEDYSSVNK